MCVYVCDHECVIILPISNNSSLAAVQVSFAQQNHTVTEGDIVNITLHLSSSHEFDFTVTFQHMDGSATGESSEVAK